MQLGVQAWMFSNIEDLCSADQPDSFVCLELVCHCGVSSDHNICSRSRMVTSPTVSFFPPGWHNRTPWPMDITPKVQTRCPQVPQLRAIHYRKWYRPREKIKGKGGMKRPEPDRAGPWLH
jgi:hypothetical protein